MESVVKKNIKNTIVAGTASVIGGVALLGAAAPAQADSVNWDAVAECESGGNWSTSTGNGFSGGLQFTPSTWAAYGGSGDASTASKAEQIRVAENVLDGQGIGAWPNCGPLGLSGAATSTPAPAAETQVSTQSVETPAPAPAPAAEEAPVAQAPAAEAPAAPAPAAEAPAAQAPVAEQAPVVEYTAPAAPVVEQPAVAGTYTVVSGDTLGSIADAYGIDWETLYAANTDTVADPNLIFVGQTLNIPA